MTNDIHSLKGSLDDLLAELKNITRLIETSSPDELAKIEGTLTNNALMIRGLRTTAMIGCNPGLDQVLTPVDEALTTALYQLDLSKKKATTPCILN